MEQQTKPAEIEVLAHIIGAALQIRRVGETSMPFVILPEGYRVEDIERSLPAPVRKRGSVALHDEKSFIAYVRGEMAPDTRLYRSLDPPQFLAVINDHGAQADWRDYRARYTCPLSAEWKTWLAANGKKATQEEFARFIEDNLPDIVDPPGAEMLEISRTLQAKKKINFASGIRLDNGQHQLSYEEQISGSAGAKGQLRLPEEFNVGIAVFDAGERYRVQARLRYRILEGGSLHIWYDLVRPHKLVEDALEQITGRIEAALGTVALKGEILG